MQKEKIKSKFDEFGLLTGATLIFIVLIIVYGGFILNGILGILLCILTIYIYSNFFYTVYLYDQTIELKYVWKKKCFTVHDIDYLETVSGPGVLTMALSFKLKSEKKRINFGFGNTENLLKILNFSSRNKIEIIDHKDLLSKYNIDKTQYE